LARERVEVERIAIGKPIDAIPAVRQDGDTTIIPVVEEVLVVERRLVLKEEIHIHRVRTTEQHQERVTLRRQEAVITRLPIETTPGETGSVPDSDPGENVSSKE
jgi:stress response protein YsnF